jgi:hypothetical protein
MLEEFYFSDPRMVLVPIEHLSPAGVSSAFAAVLVDRIAAGAAVVDCLSRAFPLYWERTADLARRSRTWAPPRLRNIAIVDSETAIPPYVQLLNTSTWTMFDCDFATGTSSDELLAYLFVQGDRMAITGEVTLAALHNAAYWFDRSGTEVADFQRGARASMRPDADAYVALADAIGWLRQLSHETLRPPPPLAGQRAIAATGLLIPASLEGEPPRLVERWTRAAKTAVERYYAAYQTAAGGELAATLEWLRDSPHEFVVTGRDNRILWDRAHPERIGAVRNELRRAGAATLRSIRADLATIDHHSVDFRERAALGDALPPPDESIAQDGFTYLYRGRRVLAYNLDDPDLDRLRVPGLPFASAMLGARAYHEWSHLAVSAGWVRCTATEADLDHRIEILRDALDDALAAAPQAARQVAGVDLLALTRTHGEDFTVDWGSGTTRIGGATGGAALLRMVLPRAADFQANLLAARLQSDAEREAYVRHNVRTLRGEYGAAQMWRMFARYLYELQYLRFSEVPDKREYFLRSTWFDADFLDSGIVSDEAFDRIDRAFSDVLDVFGVDPAAMRL